MVKTGVHSVPAGPEYADRGAGGTRVTEVPFLGPRRSASGSGQALARCQVPDQYDCAVSRMSALDSAGLSEASDKAWNAIRCRYVSRSPSRVTLLLSCSVMTTSCCSASM